MILAIDVHYVENTACVAGVSFDDWIDEQPSGQYISILDNVQDYEPGQFYKRELPCMLFLLEEHSLKPETIVIDGHVYLDGVKKAGLGKKVYDALNGSIEVLGVAKNAFHETKEESSLFRGGSSRPLFITSTSDLAQAKQNIAKMHGKNRIPVLLKLADSLCRRNHINSLSSS